MFIYKISNDINNKVYIGRTTRTIKQRWKEHLQSLNAGDCRQIYAAMRKYGVEHFKIEPIYECDNLDELVQAEYTLCKQYRAYTDGYNMTEAGEINPMECEKAKETHNYRMKSIAVRSKISATMKKVREKSKNYIYIHKDKEQKRIDPSDLQTFINNGWEEGTIKGKIRLHNIEGKETTVFADEVDSYLTNGWIRGGKPNRISLEHRKKLNSSHHLTEQFKKDQSERLKEFYASNPHWKTKSKHAVIIINPKDSTELYEFDSCLEFVRSTCLPDYIAKAGIVGQWIKQGYIKSKNNKYNNWIIQYKE